MCCSFAPYWVAVCDVSFIIYSYQSFNVVCLDVFLWIDFFMIWLQAKIYAGQVDKSLKKWLLKIGDERADNCTTVRRLFMFYYLFLFALLCTCIVEFL